MEDVPRPESVDAGDVLVQVEVALTDSTDAKALPTGSSRSCSGRRRAASGTSSAGSTSRPDAASSRPTRRPAATVLPASGARRRSASGCCLCSTARTPSSCSSPARIARVNLHPVPHGVPAEVAAMVEPLACCLHGVDVARIEPGDTVAVVGVGPIGLMLCACVADAGGRPVAVGSRPERRELASLFGAVPAEPEGADVVIEATGTAEGWTEALRLVRPGGTVLGVQRAAPRRAARDRPLPDPLRGGDAARRVPPHAAHRAGGARVPRERRLPVRAPDHPHCRSGRCRRAPHRSAAGTT